MGWVGRVCCACVGLVGVRAQVRESLSIYNPFPFPSSPTQAHPATNHTCAHAFIQPHIETSPFCLVIHSCHTMGNRGRCEQRGAGDVFGIARPPPQLKKNAHTTTHIHTHAHTHLPEPHKSVGMYIPFSVSSPIAEARWGPGEDASSGVRAMLVALPAPLSASQQRHIDTRTHTQSLN